MEEKYNKQSINRFDFITEEKINTLKQNDVKTLGELANKTITNLKEYGFENFEINKIDIELQLLGLNLKSRN